VLLRGRVKLSFDPGYAGAVPVKVVDAAAGTLMATGSPYSEELSALCRNSLPVPGRVPRSMD
jgi:hypothetical protein